MVADTAFLPERRPVPDAVRTSTASIIRSRACSGTSLQPAASSRYDGNLQLNPDQIDPTAPTSSASRPATRRSFRRSGGTTTTSPGRTAQFLGLHATARPFRSTTGSSSPRAALRGGAAEPKPAVRGCPAWLRFIFDPDSASRPIRSRSATGFPSRFTTLTASAILAQRINNLLVAVNNGDPSRCRRDDQRGGTIPFNPFLLADQRPVAYMKRTVMSYLDNLIAWGDNLFATDSREALNEATLLYVTASEILGPSPAASPRRRAPTNRTISSNRNSTPSPTRWSTSRT